MSKRTTHRKDARRERPRAGPTALAASRAYQVFLHEIARAADQVRTVLDEGLSHAPNEQAELARTFHTAKGGAGFLGLTDVAEVASALEEIFARAEPAVPSEEFTSLVTRFEEALARLPRTKERPDG